MDRDAVHRLAHLSKLRLTAEQAIRVEARIQRLLDAFAVLEEISTDGIEPSPYPLPMAHRGRADVAEPGLPQEEVLANAPERRAGCFRVPRVVEG